MHKISFKNDYSEGAHPLILQQLLRTNLEQQAGYGNDSYSQRAKELLQEKIAMPAAGIHFTAGGTQANLLVIGHLLKPYEAVISARTGHIAVHETGAIEATGHKVVLVDAVLGKLTVQAVKEVLDTHTDEHMVKPAMVYISNATELGSVYTKAELTELSVFCRERKLQLFMDGARLGSALTSRFNDLTFSDLAKLVDVFYIGGTKNGALLGEAIVFAKQGLDEGFRYYLKQKGALLAKGRLLGVQFLTLFEHDLYLELAHHANAMAEKIAAAFEEKGYAFFLPPQSNQLFPLLPNAMIEKLQERFDFYVWHKPDQHTSAIRLVTSWATEEENVDAFIRCIHS
ncbi:threonine aldolase family protein [Botryobacter ruber]|uniref:threonine aldolase family protein n=1 Tax=Botryobacter ruber TaxID=2171629 RepID=UPI000E0C5CEB|nr:aminotransferase class I/II-fold pyridoxal phosphate-dependent enzyme [Botryobacter ruber]